MKKLRKQRKRGPVLTYWQQFFREDGLLRQICPAVPFKETP